MISRIEMVQQSAPSTVTTLRYNSVQWCIVDLFVWVGIWNYLRIYRLPIDPVKKFVALKCFLKR